MEIIKARRGAGGQRKDKHETMSLTVIWKLGKNMPSLHRIKETEIY
jgi:hypothetical protein